LKISFDAYENEDRDGDNAQNGQKYNGRDKIDDPFGTAAPARLACAAKLS
jgi:hypothetical protein